MYKIIKGFDCRTVKGTPMTVTKGTTLESYIVNYDRDSVTLNFLDMTCEIENDFDIAEYIVSIPEDNQKDNTVKYDVKVTDKTNQELKEATLAAIKYLRSIDCTNLEQTIVNFLGKEEKRLQKEYDKLSILTASDDEIIQNALLNYANEYLAHYDTETANKIRDVRDRYLERKDCE